MNGLHRSILRATGGRLGWRLSRMPALELTTVGRKTGLSRATMLTSPYQEGPNMVIVASRGGDDTHPAWFLNLRDEPRVMVKLGSGSARPMTAEIIGSDERARIWPIIAETHRNYAGYQRKTSREIPLVWLRPIH